MVAGCYVHHISNIYHFVYKAFYFYSKKQEQTVRCQRGDFEGFPYNIGKLFSKK